MISFRCHSINNAKTYPYSPTMSAKLRAAGKCSGEQLINLHIEFGHYIGKRVNQFLEEFDMHPGDVKFVAVHGHTIFHQPSRERFDDYGDDSENIEQSCTGRGFTFQLGDGETIASHVRAIIITNFRNKDVALCGQGAPLVPIGEHHLFHQYNCFLNLGGIANVSSEDKGFDICPCNMLLNHIANLHDSSLNMDENGSIAQRGHVIQPLLNQLNNLEYYSLAPPKSLGREWVERNVFPLLDLKVGLMVFMHQNLVKW